MAVLFSPAELVGLWCMRPKTAIIVKKGLCQVLENVDVDVDADFLGGEKESLDRMS